MKVDKITLEILKNHSRAVAEVWLTLYRTAYSTLLKRQKILPVGLQHLMGKPSFLR